jgi:hypothetical protein
VHKSPADPTGVIDTFPGPSRFEFSQQNFSFHSFASEKAKFVKLNTFSLKLTQTMNERATKPEMVLLDNNLCEQQHQQCCHATRTVSFHGLDWIEEMKRTKRGQEKRQEQREARLATKKYYKKSKRKQQQVQMTAATTAAAATALADTMILLPFQSFLEFFSSPPCNTKTNRDIRQGVPDLTLCSPTLSTFHSRNNSNNNTDSTMTSSTEVGTQADKTNLIHQLKGNMMLNKKQEPAPPLDIVVYYGAGLSWMMQAKSNDLYDNDAKPTTRILTNSSAGGGNAAAGIGMASNDKDDMVIRHQYQDGGSPAEVFKHHASSQVQGKVLIETVSDENTVPRRAQPFTGMKAHEPNGIAACPTRAVRHAHPSSSHQQGSDTWLVCCAQSF